MADPQQTEALIAAFRSDHDRVKKEVQKAIVGHEEIIDGILVCLFAGGHALLEGVPGLGKTLLIRSLSQALQLKFGRIQFTPDLMPADVTGTTIVVETPSGRDFQFRKGPLFAQIVLADEINRATPKTQSAMLEAMQERSVTVGGTRSPRRSSTASSSSSRWAIPPAPTCARSSPAPPPVPWRSHRK
jgi:MoxR-like ATPase